MALRCPVPQLRTFLERLFCEYYNFPDDQAAVISDALIDADAHGVQSHGVQRLSMYDAKLKAGTIVAGHEGRVVSRSGATSLIDGELGMGQVVAHKAMSIAIESAGKYGIGIVAVRNSNHFGTAGHWANMALGKAFIGLAFTNSNPLTVPTFGICPFGGSNPIAFSAPGSPEDFAFDAATSTVSLGKIEVLRKTGAEIPGQWAVDEHGNTDTSADHVMRNITRINRIGGLTPIGGPGETNGGYKGYGLGLVIEILTGLLAGGQLSADLKGKSISHTFLAIDPGRFGDIQGFKLAVSNMQRRLRALPSEPGKQVIVPGDKERAALRDIQRHGVPIDEVTVHQIARIADEAGLPAPWEREAPAEAKV